MIIRYDKPSKQDIYHTFSHPDTWGCDVAMSTCIKNSVWQIPVFVNDMGKKSFKFSEL